MENENTIQKIIVFYGFHTDFANDDLDTLFLRDPKDPVFKVNGAYIFSKKELEIIQKNKTSVHFSDVSIHPDDTIAIVKIKIMNVLFSEFGNQFSNTLSSLNEMYLFCLQTEKINPMYVYQILTQKGRLPLTRTRLDQFLLNIIYTNDYQEVVFDVPDKEQYTYDDIVSLNMEGIEYIASKVVGQSMFLVTDEYPFVVNPFDIIEYDDFIERISRKSLSTVNSQLLLNVGDLVENNLYLCLASDVLRDHKAAGISEKTTIDLYFPLLNKSNVHSLSDLETNRILLRQQNEPYIQESFVSSFQTVDLFYDVYKERKNELNYKQNGIKRISITMVPEFTMKIPLDIVFKYIHATDVNPLIKYNPATRQENIYRLFTKGISKDGRKIPHMDKSDIFKWSKNIGKFKSVSILIYFTAKNGKEYSIVCDLEENGNTGIMCEFDTVVAIGDIDSIFEKAVNPVMEEIRDYLQQNGYTLPVFHSVLDKNVLIDYMDYQTEIMLQKEMQLHKIAGCVSSIFVTNFSNKKKDKENIEMRFKRVANYNEVTSQEAFIIEQTKDKNGLRGEELELELQNTFKISLKEAQSLLVSMANNLQVERGVKRRDIEIKINPGFKTTIAFQSLKSSIVITVEKINDIHYLQTIPIYLDSLVRLSQEFSLAKDKLSTSVHLNRIQTLCNPIHKIIAPIVTDIVPIDNDEETDAFINEEKEGMVIQELEYGEVKRQTAMDLFYGEEEEEEQGEQEEQEEQGEQEEDESSGLFGGAEPEEKKEEEKEVVEEEEKEGVEEVEEGEKEGVEEEVEEEVKEGVEEGEKEEEKEGEKEIVEENKMDSVQDIASEIVSDAVIEPLEIIKTDEVINDALEITKMDEVKNDALDQISDEEPIKNIDGQKLSYPNPFQLRLEELEPILFSHPKHGDKHGDKFKIYSRSCQQNMRKQPVILTEDEMARIEKQQPGFIEAGKKNGTILHYGSNPDEKYYYLCPRYWCMKTKMPISEEDVKSGKCGKLIGQKDTVIKPGHYVYEFFNPAEHGSQEKYIQHYPGFMGKDKHSDGLCMPCCFRDWTNETQVKRRQECSQEETEVPAASTKKRTSDKDEYIIGPEKFPIPQGRWGYLPLTIQTFFQEINADCQISQTNTNIRPFYTCLLRHGVENSNKQSFLACIAYAKFYGTSEVPSIQKIKAVIIETLHLDLFLTLQNGNLVNQFSEVIAAKESKESKEPDISKYMNTTIYKRVNPENKKDVLFFQHIVRAYEHFIHFLQTTDIDIDYTYLWDIICRPHPKLFDGGLNLVILEISNSDATNNIELVCPVNQYSSEIYDPRKKTLILLHMEKKDGDYFEPIYAYRDEEKTKIITRTFSEYDTNLPRQMKNVFKKLIKPLLRNTCVPLASKPNEYTFKHALVLEKMVDILQKMQYSVETQIVNYQGKVISLVIKNAAEEKGVVPCYPSALISTLSYVLMSDETMYHSYDETTSFLEKVWTDSNKVIPCRPEFKVTEDEMVVGVLTETNQFIQIDPPEPISEITDNIKTLDSENYLVADTNTTLSTDYDTERVEYIRKIKLETNFYNVFRNTVRIFINNYDNIKWREQLETEIKNTSILYNVKVIHLIDILKRMMHDSILFSEDIDFHLLRAEDLATCITYDENKCSKKKPLCAFTTGNTCQIILPKNNLVTNTDNEIYYYAKMADELLRFKRINAFLFQPQTFLSFGTKQYQVRDDEVILLQSVLTQSYFDTFIPEQANEYVKYNTFDTAQPKITQTYENKVNAKDILKLEGKREYEPKREKRITSMQWKKCFPTSMTEMVYEKMEISGFYLVLDILREPNKTVEDVRRDLLEEYVKFLVNYEDNVHMILIEQGKKMFLDKMKSENASLESVFLSEKYYLTNLDLWLLMTRYKKPTIFLSSQTFVETKYEKTEMVAYGNETDSFIFIICSRLISNHIPALKWIQSDKQESVFPLSILSMGECRESITNSFQEKKSVSEYIMRYTPDKKKSKKRLKLEDDEIK